MQFAIDLIILATFLISLITALPYLLWMLYAAFKRRWRRLAIQTAAPVVAYGLVFLVLSVLYGIARDQYLTKVFDADVNLDAEIFAYNSERCFNGDGYSFHVYELPNEVRQRFASADERLLTEFPSRSAHPDDWSTVHWREAPFDSTCEKYLDFALVNYGQDDSTEIDVHFDNLRQAVSRRGTFYAFFHYDHRDRVGDIDFFAVDLKRERLYIVNHNM